MFKPKKAPHMGAFFGKDLAVSYFPGRNWPVSSAMKSLTAEFGMGSGVTSSPGPPKFHKYIIDRKERKFYGEKVALPSCKDKPLGQLVLVSSTPHGASTSSLSTRSSASALQDLSKSGRTYLEAGFPLRCFQRLSIPRLATLLCRWRDNRFTRGASIPVLSY